MDIKNGIRTLSLFSGGGGLDLGFEQAGFNILFATDVNHECCETLKMNKGRTLSNDMIVIEQDITTLSLDVLPSDIQMIIGGPPCQSFSASGRRAGGAAGQLDLRGNLFKSYCKVVEYVKPKAFLFENVRGILGTNKGQDFQNIIDSFAALGYKIEYRILDAEDYGVPQQRERVFIVGHKMSTPFLYPSPLWGPDSLTKTPYISVGEAIKDIPFTDKDRLLTKFEGGKYAELLPLVPPGENYLHFTAKRGYPNPIFAYRSRFSDFLYKADPKYPVKTLIASPGKYTGPFHWDNRYLSVAEYKKIQGFPSEHIFYGERVDQIKQIGNSVCPKIAYYMALAIRDQIFGVKSSIHFLPSDAKLSFDKRKGQKAQNTRTIHQAVLKKNEVHSANAFNLIQYEDYVVPTSIEGKINMHVSIQENDKVIIDVQHNDTSKIQAVLKLLVSDGIKSGREIKVKVVLRGDEEQGIQTMWNAVDSWVKRSSNFRSLVELYGHFTEPHPIFKVESFENRSDLPIFKFAEDCMDFKNCSVYFPKERLLSLWGAPFKKHNFIELARVLRGYRFDVRSHETNIAIPEGIYMVAYPFSLPLDKQMNFNVKENQTMAKQRDVQRPKNLDGQIVQKLNEAYSVAEAYFETKKTDCPPFAVNHLSPEFICALEEMSKYCEKASGGYNNLLTSLSIKAVYGDSVDIRYHQVQIQNQTDRPAGFNFRGVSESIIYPWMESHEFHGAKSGWQTRTFERPKPYMLDYDENIGTIKVPFLTCYDQIETHKQDAFYALSFLLWRRIQLRDTSKITLAIPRIQDVLQIASLFETHFFYQYKDSKGASRLPVLALYAIYTVLLEELHRFDGKRLKPLESHSAADKQTGAIGDIEIVNADGSAFEAIEVKHGLPITEAIVDSVKQKIRGSQVDRYYILTTHPQHEPSPEVLKDVEDIKKMLGCQLIVNGVVPSIKYYLRLLTTPGTVLSVYAKRLEEDEAIGFEHRDVWNKIATGTIPFNK